MRMPQGKIPPEWLARQHELAAQIQITPFGGLPRYIAGADIAFSSDGSEAIAVAIVWDRETNQVLEKQIARRRIEFPYVPGFLSFREGPALLDAIGLLTHPWEVICFDGQGMAHPRKCGLASHVGVRLDRPAIGCAKSRLIGTFADPPLAAGSYSPLMNETQQIGIVLRTRTGVNPIFVSVGHKMDLDSARRIVMSCVSRYRIPEPTRQADILTKKHRMS